MNYSFHTCTAATSLKPGRPQPVEPLPPEPLIIQYVPKPGTFGLVGAMRPVSAPDPTTPDTPEES